MDPSTTPARSAVLSADQTTDLALYCDRPMAAKAALTRLGLVAGTLDSAGNAPALWTAAWAVQGADGSWSAAAAGSDPRPGREYRAEAAVLLLHDSGGGCGASVPDIEIDRRPAKLATRGDIERAVRTEVRRAGINGAAVALSDWPVPDAVTVQVDTLAQATPMREVDARATSTVAHEIDLYSSGQQINGEPLPAGEWCFGCGTALVESAAVAHGVCADCFGIDCIRDEHRPAEIWQHALDTMRDGQGVGAEALEPAGL